MGTAADATEEQARDSALRAAIVAGGRRLGERGLISAGEGNLSIRLSGGRILVTPSGLRKDELAPADLLVVGLAPGTDEPHPRGLRATSDIAIHRAIYASRPDVLAVVHAHLPASMALTLAGHRPDPASLPETAHHLPRLPLVAFGEMGSLDLAGRVAAALAEPPSPLPAAALLERHGAIAVGTSEGDDDGPDTGALVAAIVQAVDSLELVEVLCRVWRDALATGWTPPAIP